MRLIDADKLERRNFSECMDSMEMMCVVDSEPTVKAIPLDKVKKAREVIENLTPWDEGTVEMYDVLEILDKLIESEDKQC